MKTSQVYLDKLEIVKKYIMDYWKEHKFSPASDEIAVHFGVSKSVAAYWLKTLVKFGWLEPREPGISRNIVPVEISGLIHKFFEGKGDSYDSGL